MKTIVLSNTQSVTVFESDEDVVDETSKFRRYSGSTADYDYDFLSPRRPIVKIKKLRQLSPEILGKRASDVK